MYQKVLALEVIEVLEKDIKRLKKKKVWNWELHVLYM